MRLRERDLVPEKKKKTGVKSIVFAALLALPSACGVRMIVHNYFLFPVSISTDDMAPSLVKDQVVYVNRRLRSGDLKPGMLVLIKNPADSDQQMVRRVVALDEDTVQLQDRRLIRNGSPVMEAWETAAEREQKGLPLPGKLSHRDNTEIVQLTKGFVYVLADNRKEGMDSRNFGPIRLDSIVGEVIVRK